MRLRLRQATADDLDAVIAITTQGRNALAQLGIDQWQGGNPSPERVREDIELGWEYVAVPDVADVGDGMCEAEVAEAPSEAEVGVANARGECILGVIVLCGIGELDYDNLTSGSWLTASSNDANVGEVRYVVVHRLATTESATRQGVATFMLGEAARIAREQGYASLRVDTHHGNGPMQHTFERCGFVRCCEMLITADDEPTKERIGFELVL